MDDTRKRLFGDMETQNASYGPTANTTVNTETATCAEAIDIVFLVIYAIVGTAVFFANALTCLVFLTSRPLRETYMNVFLVSLAFSDLLMALLQVPGHAALCTGCSESFRQLVSPRTCRNLDGVKDYVFLTSIFNVLAITYDRYLAVLRPLHYRRRMTRLSVSLLLAHIWTTPVPLAFLKPILEDLGSDVLKEKRAKRLYDILIVSSCVILPIFILVIVNCMITNAIRKQLIRVPCAMNAREREQTKRERRGTVSCLVIVLVFIISWVPRCLLNFLFFVGIRYIDVHLLEKISIVFLLTQSFINPLVYSFYRRDFRHAALNMRRKVMKCLRMKDNDVQIFSVSYSLAEGNKSFHISR